MKIYIVLLIVVVIVCGTLIFFSWKNKAQADIAPYVPQNDTTGQIEVMDTDVGSIYIDRDSIQPMKKDNSLYLLVLAEEIYIDRDFLQNLRAGENLQNVVACSTLYMFTSDGRYYATVKQYLIDDKNMVCADLGGSTELKSMADNEEALKVYTTALQILDKRKN